MNNELCDRCPTSAAPALPGENPPNAVERGINLEVEAWPNPTDTKFSLKLKTAVSHENAQIEVHDMSNKLVHTNKFGFDELYRFGDKLEGGIYNVRITQSGQVVTLRLVKY